jgi:hypothetical protein
MLASGTSEDAYGITYMIYASVDNHTPAGIPRHRLHGLLEAQLHAFILLVVDRTVRKPLGRLPFMH